MSFFITGTGTGVGKTIVTGKLAHALQKQGHRVITQKWVQTGALSEPDDLTVHDRFIGPQDPNLQKIRCPYVFQEPISPHLAADWTHTPIDPAYIISCFKQLQAQFSHVLIEGTGGALVPYSPRKTLLDIAIQLQLPIIIVSPNQVGTLHATFSTIEALQARNAQIWGTILNTIAPTLDPKIQADNAKQINMYRGVPLKQIMV